MQSLTNISIAKPCHQSWANITQSNSGRFCNSCAKTVVDFTRMNDEQIITYLSANANTCGRFGDMQIASINAALTIEKQTKFNVWKRMAFAFTLLTATQYSSAQTQTLAPATEQHHFDDTADKAASAVKIERTKTITGRVFDKATNTPLPGTTVYVPNTDIAASTDGNGYFKITIPSSAKTLRFSFIGYDIINVKVRRIKNGEYKLFLKEGLGTRLGEVAIVVKPQPKSIFSQLFKRSIKNIFG